MTIVYRFANEFVLVDEKDKLVDNANDVEQIVAVQCARTIFSENLKS